jgi:hypothetical protein
MENAQAQSTMNEELTSLRAIKRLNEQVNIIIDDTYPLNKLCAALAEIVENTHVILFELDTEDATLNFEASYPTRHIDGEARPAISAFNPPVGSHLETLLNGREIEYTPGKDDSLGMLDSFLSGKTTIIHPLQHANAILGFVAVSSANEMPLTSEQQALIKILAPFFAQT